MAVSLVSVLIHGASTRWRSTSVMLFYGYNLSELLYTHMYITPYEPCRKAYVVKRHTTTQGVKRFGK